MPWVSRLAYGFSLRISGFEPKPVRVRFMVVKTALKKNPLRLDWMGQGTGLDVSESGEIFCLLSGIEPRHFDRPANTLSNYKPVLTAA